MFKRLLFAALLIILLAGLVFSAGAKLDEPKPTPDSTHTPYTKATYILYTVAPTTADSYPVEPEETPQPPAYPAPKQSEDPAKPGARGGGFER